MIDIFSRPRMTRFKLVGSFARFVMDLVIIALLYGIMANAVGDRLSKQLDDVDPTNEEMIQAIPFAAEANR
jgi:hypothetical protein